MSVRAWSVYLVRCSDASLYAGVAADLGARIEAHNAGRGAKYTRARRPVVLVWKRTRLSPGDARRIEYALKQLTRNEKLRLVVGDVALWRRVRRTALGT